MKTISLSLLRLYELAHVIDSVELKSLGIVKDIRLTSNLVKDLKGACKEYAEKRDILTGKQVEIAKEFQKIFQERIVGIGEKEKNELVKELDEQLQKKINDTLGDEMKQLDRDGEVPTGVELADEKHKKLCELFEKYGGEKYLRKDVYIEVADALGLE